MRIRSILFSILAVITIASSSRAQDLVNVKFSIYLIPTERKDANENFTRIKDIHYAYGEKNIPISLKEARQSMAYPYSGPKTLTFFYVKQVDGEETRVPLCTTAIPNGVKKGILVMRADKAGSYSVLPHWYGTREMHGGGRILNLSNRMIALKIGGKKNAVVINPKQKASLQAKFTDKSGYGYIPVIGYIQEKKPDGTTTSRKAIYKNFVFKDDDAHLVLLLSKQQNFIQSLCLSANGVPNKRSLTELQKHLPHYLRVKKKSGDSAKSTPGTQSNLAG